jgi:hypothetical protein
LSFSFLYAFHCVIGVVFQIARYPLMPPKLHWFCQLCWLNYPRIGRMF